MVRWPASSAGPSSPSHAPAVATLTSAPGGGPDGGRPVAATLRSRAGQDHEQDPEDMERRWRGRPAPAGDPRRVPAPRASRMRAATVSGPRNSMATAVPGGTCSSAERKPTVRSPVAPGPSSTGTSVHRVRDRGGRPMSRKITALMVRRSRAVPAASTPAMSPDELQVRQGLQTPGSATGLLRFRRAHVVKIMGPGRPGCAHTGGIRSGSST